MLRQSFVRQSRAHISLEDPKWQQLSYVRVLGIVRGFEKKKKKEDSLENFHSILFCLIKKRSVQTFVCFGSFFNFVGLMVALFAFRKLVSLILVMQKADGSHENLWCGADSDFVFYFYS